jgi:hypothetical protein
LGMPNQGGKKPVAAGFQYGCWRTPCNSPEGKFLGSGEPSSSSAEPFRAIF